MTGLKLVGDIGGTNARFALIEPGSTIPRQIDVLACSEYPSFSQALASYLHSQSVTQLREAALAVGMPVVDDWLEMTNNDWSFSRTEVQRKFGLDKLLFTNDFSALALAVPLLGEDELVAVGGGGFVRGETIGVIGPGTGLGVSGLVCGRDGQWTALQGEGGHVTLAPQSTREHAIVRFLQPRFSRVSAERFLSGPGLCLLLEALRHLDGLPQQDFSAADITARALAATDAQCVEAVSIFCSQLGSVAGDLALTLGAEGGIYIGGGIVPRLGDHFINSQFRASFEDKGRMNSYLAGIGTRIIMAEYPALRGVATLLA